MKSRLGRNDPCPCGSGKKYKQCCLAQDEARALDASRSRSAQLAAIPVLVQQAVAHHQAGQWQEAEALYRQILAADPRDPDALHLLGVLARHAGRHQEAIDLISKAIAVLPSEANFYSNIGPSYRALGHLDQAMKAYRKALELKPDHADAYNNLANLLLEQGRQDEAIASFLKAIELNPVYPEAFVNVGNVFRDLQQYDDALACYGKAIEIRPDYADAFHGLAYVLNETGDEAGALACFEKVLVLAPDRPGVNLNFGKMVLKSGDLERAATLFAQAARQHDPEALNLWSAVLKDLGRIGEAEAAAREAMRLAPESGAGLDCAIRLAVLAVLRNDWSEAACLLAAGQAIRDCTDRPMRAYSLYLAALLKWRNEHPDYDRANAPECLYAVGDSHVLSLHGLPAVIGDRPMVVQARWVEGCKAWHLANPAPNKFKQQVLAALARLPAGAAVLICVGEIDCRVEEGIFKYWQSDRQRAIEALVEATVSGLIGFIASAAQAKGLHIVMQGVPARNGIPPALPAGDLPVFLGLAGHFNQVLRKQSVQVGFGFLDLFALTDTGNGFADGAWHLDSHHLRPDALLQALAEHLIPAPARLV